MPKTTPTRQRRRDDQTCVWPNCDKSRRRLPDVPAGQTPLCGWHLAQAVAVHKEVSAIDVEHMGLASRAAAAAAPKPEPKPPEPGWIYFLQSGGHIKIGWTSNLEKRMRSYPPGSQLLAVHPGTRREESRLHRKFSAHRTHGREWYPLAADLVRHVDSVRAEHGDPPAVDFAGKPAEIPRPHSDRSTIKPKGWPRHIA